MKIRSSILVLGLLASVLAADIPGPRKAPELAFSLPGQGDRLLSQYRGKVVAIEFILTTCPHCQAAAKTMTRFQQEFGERGFQAIDLAINALDDGRKQDQASYMVESFANTYGAGFPVGYIGRDPMMSFMGFSVMDRMVVPQLVLIDRKGVIRYQTPASDSNGSYATLMNQDAIRQHIEELLAERATAASRRPVAKKA